MAVCALMLGVWCRAKRVLLQKACQPTHFITISTATQNVSNASTVLLNRTHVKGTMTNACMRSKEGSKRHVGSSAFK